jgi:hypothetical protein
MKGQNNQGLDKLFDALPASQCALVPAYIAYGLLQNMALEQNGQVDKPCKKGTGNVNGKCAPAFQDLEFHQDMLRKLALHLAAQPDTEEASLEQRNLQNVHLPTQAVPVQNEAPPQPVPLQTQGCQPDGNMKGRETGDKSLSLRDQEFQQEMLRKLALHLAAQDAASQEHPEGVFAESPTEHKAIVEESELSESIVTPEVFPATPSSFGDEQCEHYYIGDEQCDEVAEDTCCWPPRSQCVLVPIHLAYSLLDGIAHRKDGAKTSKQIPNSPGTHKQEFHYQMLEKLALHLASQSEPLQVPPTPAQENGAVKPAKSKHCWADITDDDDDVMPQPSTADHAKTDSLNCKIVATANSKQTRPDQQQFQQDMLLKLALHLAAQPESDERVEEIESALASEAKALGEDKATCDRLVAELEPASNGTNARAVKHLEWILPRARTLSLTQSGCRVVQKVVDVASAKQREQLLEILLPEFAEIYTSPYANHVVAKLVEVMPAKNLASIGKAMQGKATTVARHQFGSRILERLIEHCGENEIAPLLDELLEDFEALARHQFGNFVVARLLEHGRAERKHTCIQKLLPYVLQHATHKTACNIVQRMLEHADLSSQTMIADAFLAGCGETSLEAIAATRYGSFVIQHLVDRFHPRIDAVKARIKAARSELQASAFSQRKIVQFLGEAFFRD